MDDLTDSSRPIASVDVHADSTGTLVVAISGELDLSTIPAVEAEVAPALDGGPPGLAIDLAGLTFADSSAIALWVRWSMRFEHFELRNPPPLVTRVLGAMGLNQRLGVSP